jgi:hypothetical protein
MEWLKGSVELHEFNGQLSVTPNNLLIYQVNQSRLGQEGQGINQFLNGVPGQDYRNITPWIWTVIQFDAGGRTREWVQGDADPGLNNLQIFPAYDIYTNGFHRYTFAEGDLTTFMNLNSTSQYGGPR